MIRLFAAIPLPPEIASGLIVRQTGLEGALWRSPDSLHLTLRFFGDVREDVARDLDAELLTLRMAPFDLVLEGAGAFAEDLGVRAVWAGVAENPELRRLAKACEAAARRAGLKPETRAFRPHVTLAYMRHGNPVAAGQWVAANNLLKSPPIRVDRFGLYSSLLGSAAPHYVLEAEYAL